MRPFFLFLLCISASILAAQYELTNEWNYGGSGSDRGRTIYFDETDGTFVIAGGSNSLDIDLDQNAGDTDFWILKVDQTGAIIWSTSVGGSSSDWIEDIQPAADGSYILAGFSFSSDEDFDDSYGSADAWIIKMSINGDVQWMHNYGGTGNDFITNIAPLANGQIGFIGYSSSSDIDLPGNYGLEDAWAGAVGVGGDLLWSQNYGGSNYDQFTSIIPASSGGWVLGGNSSSDDFDLNSNFGLADFWILKTDDLGSVQNNLSIGGEGLELSTTLLQTTDGYLFTGYSDSNTGAFAANHGGIDAVVFRLDENFALQWLNLYGGSETDLIFDAKQAPFGGFSFAASSSSDDQDLPANNGDFDAWFFEIDQAGSLLGSTNFGGTNTDRIFKTQFVNDEWLAIGGSYSTDLDVAGNYGLEDVWLLQIDPGYSSLFEIESENPIFKVFPNPASHILQLSLNEKPLESGQVSIFHESGKLLTKRYVNNGEVDISRLSPNIYYLKLVQEGDVFWSRFVCIK